MPKLSVQCDPSALPSDLTLVALRAARFESSLHVIFHPDRDPATRLRHVVPGSVRCVTAVADRCFSGGR